jgi:hypothetical protein
MKTTLEKLCHSVWWRRAGHRRHAAMTWLENGVALDQLLEDRVPVKLHHIGLVIHLHPDGTYQVEDTTGG